MTQTLAAKLEAIGGADPDLVRKAMRDMVVKGKGVSTLPAFIDEWEAADKRQPRNFEPPPPALSAEEQRKVDEEGIRLWRERARGGDPERLGDLLPKGGSDT